MKKTNEHLFEISSQNKQQRLDIFLQDKLKITRSQIKNFISLEKVLVNNKPVKAGYSLKKGDRVLVKEFTLPQISLKPENLSLDIVFENQDFAIINKQQGFVVHPAAGNLSGTLVNALMFHLNSLSSINKTRPGIVHRLDKDTSGLLIVAKNNKAHEYFAKLFKQRKVTRKYMALCSGYFSHQSGEITTNLCRHKTNRKKIAVCLEGQGRVATTKFKVLKQLKGHTLVEFSLVTGRTHQIRVHANYIKHPIVGDGLYGGNTKLFAGGQLLHSYFLEFVSPTDGSLLSFKAELPDSFSKVLKSVQITD